jgi:hypothetical protein
MTEDAFIAAVLGNPVNRAILDRLPTLGLAERAEGDPLESAVAGAEDGAGRARPGGPVAPAVTAKQ